MSTSLVAQYRTLIGTLVPVMGGVGVLLMLHPWIKARLARYFPYIIGLSWFVTRIVLFVLIYVFCIMPGDFDDLSQPYDTTVKGGWVYQATRLIAGQMPYRDFFSNYSVLYSYIISLPYRIWHSPSAFVPLYILFDLACLFLLYGVAKSRLGRDLARDAVVLFTFAPITWYVTIRHAQDEILIAFFALAATYAWVKNKRIFASVLLGLGFCCTKFMFGLIILPFLLMSDRKLRDTGVVAAVILAINLPFVLAGANVLSPFSNQEGTFQGAGFWPVVVSLFGLSEHDRALFWGAIFLLLIPLLVSIYLIPKRKIWPVDAACALMMIFIALSPKPMFYHALGYMPLFMVYAVGEREVLNLVLFSVFGLIIPKFGINSPATSFVHISLMIVYALYITVVQLYWAWKILRSYKKKAGGLPEETPSPVTPAKTAA